MTTIQRAQTFLNSIGVCTHLSYTDGAYNNVSQVITNLKYLGVSNVRDSLQQASHLAAYQMVAAAGCRFTLAVGGGVQTSATLAASLNLAKSLLAFRPGSVVAMEGANEINNWGVVYNGVSGLAGAVAMQQDLYALVHGDPAFAGVGVDYFTGYAAGAIPAGPDPSQVAGLADFDTQHPYPVNGAAPYYSMNPVNSLKNEKNGAGPAVYTETGYSSNGGVAGAVNNDVQAQYTLDLLCDAFKDGVKRTYLYDLLDAYAPGSKQGDDGFGLFDYTGAAKPVAVALHNLTTLLADPGTNALSFATSPFDVSVTGLSSVGSFMSLEKSSGEQDVLVWDEPQLWVKSTGTERVVAPETATVHFATSVNTVEVFDPMAGPDAIAVFHNVTSVDLAITAHPLLVEAFGAPLLASHLR